MQNWYSLLFIGASVGELVNMLENKAHLASSLNFGT